MIRYLRFSIAGMFLLVFVVAVVVRFWPAQPRKAGEHRYTIENEELICRYFWHDDSCGRVRKFYDGTWQPYFTESSKGNCIYIYHQIFQIGTFDGSSSNTILIQLPSSVVAGDEFDIRILATNRTTKQDSEGETIGSLDELEACVFRYYNPSMHSLTDITYNSLGSIKILSMNRRFVRVELKLNDEVMMASYDNGIKNVIDLERCKADVAR